MFASYQDLGSHGCISDLSQMIATWVTAPRKSRELVQDGPHVASIARRGLWPDGTRRTQKSRPGSKAKHEQVVELDSEARQPAARKEWLRS